MPHGEEAPHLGPQEVPEAILVARKLTVDITHESSAVRVLRGVDINLTAGEVLGMVGAAGSGKTLLARTLLGLVRPPMAVVGGRIEYNGLDLVGRSEDELRKIRGTDIAWIPSNPRTRLNPLLPVGTQLKNVAQAKSTVPSRLAHKRALAALARVSIPDPIRIARALPSELSGGMCQRVVIAIALMHGPRVIIADEPTAGLDVTVQAQVLDLMLDLVHDSGATLLLMTRDLGIVANYAQQVSVLSNGIVVDLVSVSDFFNNPTHPISRALLFAARGAYIQNTRPAERDD
jgi:ABC-type dipeptide/oligopeptide/nickel transport system ATPase component